MPLPYIIIMVSIVVLLIFLGFLGNQEAKKTTKKIKKYLTALEDKYEDFIEKRLTLSILKKDTFDVDVDDILRQSIVIMKPEIEGILSDINATDLSTITVNANLKYFSNAVSLVNSLFQKSRAAEDKQLSPEDEESLYECVKDAIRADIAKRVLDFKTRNY